MPLETGLTAATHLVVTDADTAIALGSGDVPVLGTPRLVALLEEATVAAVAAHLEENQTTVGVRVEVEHLAATAVGARVDAAATLESIERRMLAFSVTAVEGNKTIAGGTVRRAVVDRQHFLNNL